VKLGTENRKTMAWALGLGAVAILAVVYEVVPMFMGSSVTPVSASQPALSSASRVTTAPHGKNSSKKIRAENLDPTLQLKLLASSEQTTYEGSGRNIFVSQAEDVVIPRAIAPGHTDAEKIGPQGPPPIPPPPPIPLKFFGFASRPGEPKKVFLSKDQDVFIAGEGEIVDRRYKVVHISGSSVEIQDLVGSGPPQTIQLTPS
jgi:hypothetical protein